MQTPETMTLSDILDRDVSMEWYDAVALVRGVVERLLEISSPVTAVPELDQIEMSSAGQVRIGGGTNVDEPVRRLGQLLQACLLFIQAPLTLQQRILGDVRSALGDFFHSLDPIDSFLIHDGHLWSYQAALCISDSSAAKLESRSADSWMD